MTNKDASVIIGNIPIEGDDCYTIAEYQEAKAMAIKALEQQPSEDCISRKQALDDKGLAVFHRYDDYVKMRNYLKSLPPVTPKYTDEEIDKAQAVEQAYVDKMVELAVEESRREWLNSFDTLSATKCFEAVNLLKQRLEGEE